MRRDRIFALVVAAAVIAGGGCSRSSGDEGHRVKDLKARGMRDGPPPYGPKSAGGFARK
jgi:hypothetical protein